MSATTDLPPAVVAHRHGAASGTAATRLAVHGLRRGALVVLAVTAGLSATVAVQYRSLVGGPLDLAAIEALAANPAIRTLFGEPVGLGTAGGFTVWRTGTPLAVLVGVWALTAATRLTRGEESSGRWSLLLAGPLRLPAVVARHVAVLTAAAGLVGAGVAAAMVLTGAGTTGSLLYGGLLAGVGALFAALGVLAAQVVPDRRTATAVAGGLLAAALLLRMVADGVAWLAWARWLTPFGLLAEAAPYAGDRVVPLVVLAAAAAVLAALAVAGAARRDLGEGLVASSATRAPRPALLGSLTGFAVRRALPATAVWSAGVAAYYLLTGLLAVSLTEFLAENRVFADAAAEAGFGGLGTVEGYTGTLFGLLAVPVGVFAAARVAADAADEADRRMTLLLAAPVARRRWALTEAGVVATACAALALAAGAATWVGTSLAGAPLGLGPALAGALNVLPVALLCLGTSLVALAWAPRAVLPLGSLPAAGGFLWLVLADSLAWPGWVRGLSPNAHLAVVPAERFDLSGGVALLAVAALLAGAGVVGWERRDVLG